VQEGVKTEGMTCRQKAARQDEKWGS
jgi:hypothetical protein